MRQSKRRPRTWLPTLALLLAAGVSPLAAQGRVGDPTLTRRELVARVMEAEQRALTLPEGAERNELILESRGLRERLQDGDFDPGDRIVVRVVGMPALTDTFAVRAGRVLELPDLPPIPLGGVLRSELSGHLRGQIGKYVINPTVEAVPLMRVAVTGAVSRPGFYALRADQPLSDAIMAAGGPSEKANIDETLVRRSGRDVYKPKRVRLALANGATIDQMGLRSGDEIVIAERTKRDWGGIARTSAYIAGIMASLYGGSRIF